MVDIPTPEQVEAIRGRHHAFSHPNADGNIRCAMCAHLWPCEVATLLAAYDALTAQNASLAAAEADTRAALLVAERERDEAQTIAAEISDERTRLQGGTDYLVRERDALTAEVERLRDDWHVILSAFEWHHDSPDRGPEPTLEDVLDWIGTDRDDAREHVECSRHCEACGERLAATICPKCHGGGCLPNPELAYLECDECGGAGWVHDGCAEASYADLATRAEAAERKVAAVRVVLDELAMDSFTVSVAAGGPKRIVYVDDVRAVLDGEDV